MKENDWFKIINMLEYERECLWKAIDMLKPTIRTDKEDLGAFGAYRDAEGILGNLIDKIKEMSGLYHG